MDDSQVLATIYQSIRSGAKLRADLDEAEYHFIGLARTMGATWEDIGEELGGISRQAARDRFNQQRRRYSPR